MADELAWAFRVLFSSWSDRLHCILHRVLSAVLHLQNGCLLDAASLLRKNSPESRRLRQQLLRIIDADVLTTFCMDDLDGFGRIEMALPLAKLSTLLASGTTGIMLSQCNSAFDLRDVMDTGKILLADLSHVGPEVRVTLGRVILSMLYLDALGRRSDREHSHRPFHIYCDGAHGFLPDAMEDLIAAMYRSNVSLTLSHEYLRQFRTHQADALSIIDSTIIFRVETRDAAQFQESLKGKASVEDLTSLGVGQAVARIRERVVRIKTQTPPAIPKYHHRDEIIARSRRLYCRPIEEVIQAIRRRHRRAE